MLGSLLRNRYNLISVLGVGGFGQTYLAKDTDHPDRPICVVKQFKPNKNEGYFLEIARRLFDTEVKILEQLGRHPQIPTFLEFFEEENEFYLVQEFIDGQPLGEEFSQRRLSAAAAIDLLTDVLEVLDFVHSQQVIHRDVKPSNLIRRRSDNKIVLIDFGAVKEIGTQLMSDAEQRFTVGIGTQGYTPSEQLAGRPRYCSDLYGLGMTVIYGLTGIQPTQLLADPDTGELIWQSYTSIGLGLQSILEKMVRYHFSQRYQSAREVLQALDQLSQGSEDSTLISYPENSSDSTLIPPSSLVIPSSLRSSTVGEGTLVDRPVNDGTAQPRPAYPQRPRRSWRDQLRKGGQIIAITAFSATGFLIGLRQLGWLQSPELAVYDHFVRLSASAVPDPRLLVVEITEADLQRLQRGTPSDQDVATVIQTLRAYQPRAIGLDLHRDLPQEPGRAALAEQLQAPEVITIFKLGNEQSAFDIPPPPGIPAERLGFNDLLYDADGVVRRNLMYASTTEQNFMSFSLRLALQYLQPKKISPQESPQRSGVMQLNQIPFIPLEPNSGGYQRLDARGYQVMLQYRSAHPPARMISFSEVLKGNLKADWVKDKIVLIGTTAPSGKDLFYTPYSGGTQDSHLMAGVIIHAQMVSQVLSVALDQQPLLWVWPDWAEVGWMMVWAGIGGSLAWFIRHPLILTAGTVVVLMLLVGTTLVIFTYQGWVPVVAPAIALIVAGATALSWRSYQIE